MKKLSHLNEHGKATMVDVSGKKLQLRIARASGRIRLNANTIAMLFENRLKKGDALTVAKIAGVQAAKRTAELIPLCHPLQITKIDVHAQIEENGVSITSEITCIDRTGAEMEALTAVSVALLTIYDMCKAVDKNMEIGEVKLLEKVKKDLKNGDSE